MEFRDLFSDRSPLYSRYRPSYPDALFDWIAGLVSSRRLAHDCATGTGQAAVGLAERFDRVIATDASAQQIAEATPHPRIEYRIATAYESGIESRSVDVVTVAQALHWLDLDGFYAEAQRVLTPGGAVVIWGYGDPVLESAPLHRLVHEYNRGTIEDYWMLERATLLDGYRSIQFPFREVATPAMTMEHAWTLEELAGYLRTWSATRRYAAAHGGDPVAAVEARLLEYWGDPASRQPVQWPLHIRAGFTSV